MKLTDLFNPEEFAEHMIEKESSWCEEIVEETKPYLQALMKKNKFEKEELVTIGILFCMLDELIRRKTLDTKSIN